MRFFERILGKDLWSLICLHVHRILMKQLNAEYCASTASYGNNGMLFHHFAYNFRHLDDTVFVPEWHSKICNKRGHIVAALPKIY